MTQYPVTGQKGVVSRCHAKVKHHCHRLVLWSCRWPWTECPATCAMCHRCLVSEGRFSGWVRALPIRCPRIVWSLLFFGLPCQLFWRQSLIHFCSHLWLMFAVYGDLLDRNITDAIANLASHWHCLLIAQSLVVRCQIFIVWIVFAYGHITCVLS